MNFQVKSPAASSGEVATTNPKKEKQRELKQALDIIYGDDATRTHAGTFCMKDLAKWKIRARHVTATQHLSYLCTMMTYSRDSPV